MADEGPALSCFDFANRGGEQESREDVLKKHPQEEERLGTQMSQVDAQMGQPAAVSSSHSSDEDRPLCQRQAAAEIHSELPDSSEEDRPLCKRHVRRPEAPETSDEDKPLSQLKRPRPSSPSESEEDEPLAQRAVQAAAVQATRPRVETSRLVALGMPAERAAGVARFSSSLPPHTRTGFELAYAYAAAL